MRNCLFSVFLFCQFRLMCLTKTLCSRTCLFSPKQESYFTYHKPVLACEDKIQRKKKYGWLNDRHLAFTLFFFIYNVFFFFLSLEFTLIRSQSFKRQPNFCSICIRRLCMALKLGFKNLIRPWPPPSWCFYFNQRMVTFCRVSACQHLYNTNRKYLICVTLQPCPDTVAKLT